VPLAAALWKGGISFGGVIAFVFADLLALPLVLIYRKFYGTRLAIQLSFVFWGVMSAAGLVTEGVFQLVGLVPAPLHGDIATTHFGLNYTTVLDALALFGFGYLYWLHRNGARYGAGTGYAKDVVCGMQVRTADAAARTDHEGQTFYFCSDRCREKFEAAPERFVAGAVATASEGTGVTDPVCGMTVDPAAAGATAAHGGRSYHFCCDGCREAFVTDPGRYLVSDRAGSGQ
jgi:uncharacterized protein